MSLLAMLYGPIPPQHIVVGGPIQEGPRYPLELDHVEYEYVQRVRRGVSGGTHGARQLCAGWSSMSPAPVTMHEIEIVAGV